MKPILFSRPTHHTQKAEVSQIFFYILALITFAVILIFGYQSITDFMAKGERVSFITFKTDLERTVQRVTPDYGSVVVYDAQHPFTVPGAYTRLCFIDMDKSPPSSCALLLNPIICDAWQTSAPSGWSHAEATVFTEPQGTVPIKVARITADTNGNHREDDGDKGYLCFPTISHRLDIRFEGRGDHTFVSQP